MSTGFDQAQAEVLARSAEISESVKAKSKEIAEASERMREENKQFCKELDERAAERAEAAKNQWSRTEQKDNTYQLGGSDDDEPEAPRAQAHPEAPVVPQVETATRGRHARKPVEDEDDYSDHNWLG